MIRDCGDKIVLENVMRKSYKDNFLKFKSYRNCFPPNNKSTGGLCDGTSILNQSRRFAD